METAKHEAIQRAIKMLVAANATFHIVADDGNAYGQPITPEKPKKIYRAGPGNKELIATLFDGMQPGDVRWASPQEGDTAKRLRANITSAAGNKWGTGSIVAVVTKDGQVEVLRVQ